MSYRTILPAVLKLLPLIESKYGKMIVKLLFKFDKWNCDFKYDYSSPNHKLLYCTIEEIGNYLHRYSVEIAFTNSYAYEPRQVIISNNETYHNFTYSTVLKFLLYINGKLTFKNQDVSELISISDEDKFKFYLSPDNFMVNILEFNQYLLNNNMDNVIYYKNEIEDTVLIKILNEVLSSISNHPKSYLWE